MSNSSLPALRIVYFSSLDGQSTNGIVQLLGALGQKVLLVVTTPGTKARPTVAYKDVAANLMSGVDMIVTSNMARLTAMLRGLEPDLIFVTGFPRLLPQELLDLPRFGSINTHPAPLPRYRGPDPVFWQLLNGEKEIGLTIHRMAGEFDTGPILAQGTAPVGPDDTMESMMGQLLPLGGRLIIEALAAVAAGAPGTTQNEADATYAPLRTEADRLLDWSKPAQELHNRVRAWGALGAWADVDGERVLVARSHLADPARAVPNARPGTIISDDEEGLVVQTDDGVLELEEVREIVAAEG